MPVKWEGTAIISPLDTRDTMLNRTVTSVLLVTSCGEEMGQGQLAATHSGGANNWEQYSQAVKSPPLAQFLGAFSYFFFSNLPPSSVLELSLHWVGDAGGGLYEMQHPSEMYAHPLILRSYAVISVWKRQ